MAGEYGTLKVEPRNQLPDKELTRVLHRGKDIVSGRFGPDWYSNNVKAMKGHFYNSSQFPNVTFRPATTSESISIALGKLPAGTILFGSRLEGDMKKEVYNPKWHQAGRIVRAQDGVYINPLTAITSDGVDERVLKSLRDNTKSFGKGRKVIRLGANDFAFIPYESFEQGVQSAGDFAEGGLARGLEYVEGDVAVNLKSMASTYRNGVNVLYFDKCEEPTARVVGLYSGRGGGSGRLYVVGYDWSGDGDGCASGVLVTSDEGGTQ